MSKTVLVTGPTASPVTMSDLRRHLRLVPDYVEDDSYIADLLEQAVEEVESRTWRKLCSQTWDQYFDQFATTMRLEYPPLASITSVKYTDTDGDEQTVDASVYEAGEDIGRGIVRLKYNQLWPSDVLGHPDSIVVRFVCGYGDADDVPARFKHAIRLLVSDAYEHRESIVIGGKPSVIAGAVDNLLSDHVREFV